MVLFPIECIISTEFRIARLNYCNYSACHANIKSFVPKGTLKWTKSSRVFFVTIGNKSKLVDSSSKR